MPFKKLISEILEQSNIDIDITKLSESINDKIMTVIRIVLDEKQFNKVEEFEDCHNHFVYSILKSTSGMKKEDSIDLLFSMSNALICLSTLMISPKRRAEDYEEIYDDYEHRLLRISRKVNHCLMLRQVDENREVERDPDWLIKHLDKCIRDK